MIEYILTNTHYKEDAKTLKILNEKKNYQNYLNKNQLLQILKWKSPRPLRHYKKNEDDFIKHVTKLSYKENNDRLKIHILTSLNGVKYPSASAILMFKDPTNYPVIDIRVWKQLHKFKLVKENPSGTNFTLDQWLLYLEIIRHYAKQYGLKAREIEKKLFDYDRLTQQGTLY
jgi:hypothetical protein